jgi:hypothetical protein
MKIYIASSWKNQHAVELPTDALRAMQHEVLSFVENNHGETNPNAPHEALDDKGKPIPFEEWCWGERGQRSFDYDTGGATTADLVIYIGPSGCDAWAEIGAAWATHRPILGLWAKGEQAGLMRRMVHNWYDDFRELLSAVKTLTPTKKP